MALARTNLLASQSTPTGGNFGTGNWTTAAFTPPASCLLVVSIGAMENSGSADAVGAAITISDSQGLTWTTAVTASASFAFSDGMRIFYAQGAAASSMTVTAGTGGKTIGSYFVQVVAYTGFDTTTPVNGTATLIQGSLSNHTNPFPVTTTLSSAPVTGDEVFSAINVNKSITGSIVAGATYTILSGAALVNSNWGQSSAQTRTSSTSTTADYSDLQNSGAGTIFDYAGAFVVVKAASGGSTINGTATLTGAGALTATAIQTIRATASLAGAGALAANVTQGATATPAGAGSLSAKVTQVTPASLAGAGVLSATATQIIRGSAALAGVGALNATAVQTIQGTASLVGAGALAAKVTQVAGVILAGAGSLSANAGGNVNGTANLVGAGVLSATAVQIIQGTASLIGAGALSAKVTQAATANLAGLGVMTTVSVQAATANLAGAGVLSAKVTQAATALLVGAGVLNANSGGLASGTAVLVGAGALTANASVIVNGSAPLVGAGALTAKVTQAVKANLVGAGFLTATPAGTGTARNGDMFLLLP